MKKLKSLRGIIIQLLILSTILPLIAIGAFNYVNSRNTLKNDFDINLKNTSLQISDMVAKTIEDSSKSIDMLSRDANAQGVLNSEENKKWLSGNQEAFLKSHEEVTSVYMGTEKGEMIVTPKADLPGDYDPRKRSWYEKATANPEKTIVIDPYEDTAQKGRFVVTFAKAVKSNIDGKVVGVIGVDMKLDDLSKLVSSKTVGKSGHVLLLDGNGTIIGSKNKEDLNKTPKEYKFIDGIINKNQVYEDSINAVTYGIFSAKEKKSNWIVATLVPITEVKDKLNSSRNVAIFISIITLLFAFVVGSIFSKKITKAIDKVLIALDKLKGGDYTFNIEKDNMMIEETGTMIDGINILKEEMVIMLRKLSTASGSVKDSSSLLKEITYQSNIAGDEIAKVVQEIANGASSQAGAMNESANSIGVLGEEVNKSIVNAKEMVNIATEVKISSNNGTKVVEELNDQFIIASKSSRQVALKVKELAEKSNEISAITDTLSIITEQTNLLALNASIEAARAGEAGKGFVVVADEVRKLAEQSASSATQIDSVISEMKSSVAELLKTMEYNMALDKATGKSVQSTKEAFSIIIKSIKNLEESMVQVDGSLNNILSHKDIVITKIEESSSVAQEIAATTEEVSASVEEQAAGIAEIVASSETLQRNSNELDELISKFKY